MSDRPTFSLMDDWVALADLDHLTFRIYCILRTNAEFARNGRVNHTLHVTASWVVDCTKHWTKPLALSTVRKHMQKLVEKGVLTRANDPNGGLGVIYSFVVDPGEDYGHPVNGFEHAKRISRRRGTTSVYRRVPLADAAPGGFTPVPNGGSEVPDVFEGAPDGPNEVDVFGAPPTDADASDEFASPFEEEPEFDMSGLDQSRQTPGQPTAAMVQFASDLRSVTAQHSEERLHLMEGACRRIAEAVRPALESGWEPRALARRLSSELNPKVHTPEALLMKKIIPDLGDPPQGQRSDGKIRVDGKLVDPASIDIGFGYDEPMNDGATQTPSAVKPRREKQSDRLARLARGMVG